MMHRVDLECAWAAGSPITFSIFSWVRVDRAGGTTQPLMSGNSHGHFSTSARRREGINPKQIRPDSLLILKNPNKTLIRERSRFKVQVNVIELL